MKRDKFIQEYIEELCSEKSISDVLGLIYDTHINSYGSFDTLPYKNKVKAIIKLICGEYEISLEQLITKTRKREIVEARQVSAYLMKENTKLSLEAIGEELGGQDHSTIKHSIKTIKNLLETNKEFKNRFQQIINKLVIKLKKKTS